MRLRFRTRLTRRTFTPAVLLVALVTFFHASNLFDSSGDHRHSVRDQPAAFEEAWRTDNLPSRLPTLLPIVSLASSSGRLQSNELIIALNSLLQQSLRPKEIRVYLPIQDRAAFETRRRDRKSLLGQLLNDALVRIHYVQDVGPSSKFIHVLRELLESGQVDQPVVVVDDDHSYSPSLVASLVNWANAPELRNAAVGFRGWKVRRDLRWGVPAGEVDEYVQEGYKLALPYQESVLTANEGYLIHPRALLPRHGTGSAQWHTLNDTDTKAAILDTERMMATSAHLVDDIWMAGHLCMSRTPRYVVPLLPASFHRSPFSVVPGGAITPSIDVTKHHTLETHMTSDGKSRAQANDETLAMFSDCWKRERLWYRPRSGSGGATSQVENDQDWSSGPTQPILVGWRTMLARRLAKTVLPHAGRARSAHQETIDVESQSDVNLCKASRHDVGIGIA